MAKFFPRKIKPMTSRIMFAMVENILADTGSRFANTTAAPVTPPKVKLFGNLKKYTPIAMMVMLIVIMKKLFMCFIFIPLEYNVLFRLSTL